MLSVSTADEEQSASCAPQVVEMKQQPTEDVQECETSGSDAEAATRTPCAFYMRTGTCAYGERCKFLHPEDRPTVFSNSRGLPLRPEEPECSFYLRNGWCAFADTCKFHHPELPPGAPTPSAGQQQQQSSASSSPSRQQQQQQQPQPQPQPQPQQQQGRPYKNGSSRHQGAGHHRGGNPSSNSSNQEQQQHGYHQGGYAYYMAPYHAGMAGPPGQGLLMHYGYYPAMQAGGSGRMYPVVTSAMIHPVMHLRPYGSMPASASMGLPVQCGALQRSSSASSGSKDGPGGDRGSGNRQGRSVDRAGGFQSWGRPGGGGGPNGSFNSRGGQGRGGGGGRANSRNKSPPVPHSSSTGFALSGPSPETKAAAAAAVAAATAAPMPRRSTDSPNRQEVIPAATEAAAGTVRARQGSS